MKISTSKIKLAAIAAIVMAFCQASFAQLTLTGEVRTRSWLDHGALGLAAEGSGTSFQTLQRSRLYADYKGDNVGAHVSIQDIRAWGATGQLYGTGANGSLGIYEAYGYFTLDSLHTFKVGRMSLSYDDERFMGGLGWLEAARTQDGFQYTMSKGKSQFDFNVLLGSNDGTSAGPYQNMILPYYKFKSEKLTVGVLGAAEINSAYADASAPNGRDSLYTRYTLGVTPSYTLGDGLKLNASVYLQVGESGVGTSVAAYQASLGITATKIKGLTLTLGGELLSGDDLTTAGYERFTPQYGTNHKFNGFMDQFYAGAMPSAGLIDLYLKTKYKFKPKLIGVLHAHYFMAATDTELHYGGAGDGQGYGSELDFVLVYKPVKGAFIKLGYSQFLGATDTMKAYRSAGGVANTDSYQGWAWLMVGIKPTLFKSN